MRSKWKWLLMLILPMSNMDSLKKDIHCTDFTGDDPKAMDLPMSTMDSFKKDCHCTDFTDDDPKKVADKVVTGGTELAKYELQHGQVAHYY